MVGTKAKTGVSFMLMWNRFAPMIWERRYGLKHKNYKCMCHSQLLCKSKGVGSRLGGIICAGVGGISAGQAFGDRPCVCAIPCPDDFSSGFFSTSCGLFGMHAINMRVDHEE